MLRCSRTRTLLAAFDLRAVISEVCRYVVLPGADAAVMRIKGTKLGYAMTTDGRGRHCYLDPRGGAAATVAEAYRNLSCVKRPVAITNCLNFGSPEKRGLPARRVHRGMAGAWALKPGRERQRKPLQRDRSRSRLPDACRCQVGVFEDEPPRRLPSSARET